MILARYGLNYVPFVSVLTIDTGFRLLSHWPFVLRQCVQDFGGVAGQERCDGEIGR